MLASICIWECRDASFIATSFPLQPAASTSRGTMTRDDGVAGTSTLRLPSNGTVGLYRRGSILWTNGAAPFLPGWCFAVSSAKGKAYACSVIFSAKCSGCNMYMKYTGASVANHTLISSVRAVQVRSNHVPGMREYTYHVSCLKNQWHFTLVWMCTSTLSTWKTRRLLRYRG